MLITGKFGGAIGGVGRGLNSPLGRLAPAPLSSPLLQTLRNSCDGIVKSMFAHTHCGSIQLVIGLQFMGGTMPCGNSVRQRCGNWCDDCMVRPPVPRGAATGATTAR